MSNLYSYWGVGECRIEKDGLTLTRRCSQRMKDKKKWYTYNDANNQPRRIPQGYEVEFQLDFIFFKDDKAALNTLLKLDDKNLINLTPRIDYPFTKPAYIEIKKRERGANYDLVQVLCKLDGLLEKLPSRVEFSYEESEVVSAIQPITVNDTHIVAEFAASPEVQYCDFFVNVNDAASYDESWNTASHEFLSSDPDWFFFDRYELDNNKAYIPLSLFGTSVLVVPLGVI